MKRSLSVNETGTRSGGNVAGSWLESVRAAFGPLTQTAARHRLTEAAQHGVIVTTGQQPGFFGGPAYTLTKPLSALALADALSAASGSGAEPMVLDLVVVLHPCVGAPPEPQPAPDARPVTARQS